MVVHHLRLEGLQALPGGGFAQEVAWELVPLPYSSIWEGSQDVVPRLSRKCAFQLECMPSQDFRALAGSAVLEGRCRWGEQGCHNIWSIVVVELVEEAQSANGSTNLQAWQIGSVSDDVEGSALDGGKGSQGRGCNAHPSEHGVLQHWADKAVVHSSAAAGVQDSVGLPEEAEPVVPTDGKAANLRSERELPVEEYSRSSSRATSGTAVPWKVMGGGAMGVRWCEITSAWDFDGSNLMHQTLPQSARASTACCSTPVPSRVPALEAMQLYKVVSSAYICNDWKHLATLFPRSRKDSKTN